MATKTLITRIKNKVDTYANWEGTTGLLDGEIAIVRVTTEEVTPAGEVVHVPALLMKVGQKDASGNPIAFNDLPWLSAKASDVYSWAKAQDPSGITVKYTKDNSEVVSASLATVLKDLREAQSDIDQLEADLADVRGTLSIDPESATANGVVQGITYNATTGKFTVSYGLVQTADIADSAVITAKIADGNVTTDKIADGNVTTAKIADGAVTNAKVASGISSDKITYDGGELTDKLDAIASDAAEGKAHANTAHDYLPSNTNYAGSSSKGGAATSANKVNAAVTFNNSGNGATSGTAFDGSAAKTISYNTIGAAGYEAVFGTNGLESKVTKNTSDIAELTESVSKGINFRGEVTTAPTGTTYTLKGESTAKTALVGDMVICGEKEYIYTASGTWKELGDLSRVTTIENYHKGVTSGTYTKVVVNEKGHVTSGSNPTTLAGYGISDAYTQDEVNSKLDEKVDTNDSRLTDARTPVAHNHASNEVTKMTGYSKPSSTSAIAATDTLNSAIGKLEKALDSKGTSNLTLAGNGSATTAAKSDHNHDSTYGQAITDIQNNYVKVADDKMYLGNDVIIFDCGGAENI